MRKLQINIGDKYNRLTVVETGLYKGPRRAVRCICSCGKETVVTCSRLINGKIKSCGCLQVESVKKRNFKHGASHTRLHNIWMAMKNRCYNSNYKWFMNYGGRGIIVCDEWRDDFTMFSDWALSNGYQDTLTIERIDVNGNYCPDNCTWILLEQQPLNQRGRVNKYTNGERIHMGELARQNGLTYCCLYQRLSSGMTLEEALSKPARVRRKKSCE